jgi:hypothetical protein
MAAGTVTLYRANFNVFKLSDLTSSNIRCALVTSSYTPDATNTGNTVWANASANEIANGNGYSTGGASLTGANSTTTNGFKFTSGNPTWTASGSNIPAWRYAVFYYLGTLWGVTNPLICYFLGDSAPADVPATSSGNTLTLTQPGGGWFDLTE